MSWRARSLFANMDEFVTSVMDDNLDSVIKKARHEMNEAEIPAHADAAWHAKQDALRHVSDLKIMVWFLENYQLPVSAYGLASAPLRRLAETLVSRGQLPPTVFGVL